MIGFNTKFKTSPENREKFSNILTRAAVAMSTIPDCVLYVVSEDETDPTVVWVTEAWTSKEAHDASLTTDAAKALISEALPLLLARPEQTKLKSLEGKGV